MGVIANNPKVYELVASSVQVEQIATGFTFTEGPIWHPDGYLLFSDMPADVRRKWTEADGIVEVMKPANKCNGMTLDADMNLIVCEHWTSQLVRARLNTDGTEASRETIASHYDGKELNSPNDVVVKSDGSIYFSDPTYGRMDVFGNPREQDMDVQGVYRLPAGGGELQRVADDYTQPNGLCFSPDEKTLYVNDSGVLHLRRYDVNADGSISGGDVILDGDRRSRRLRGRHLRRDEVRRGGKHLGHRPGRRLGRQPRRRAPRDGRGPRAHGQPHLGRAGLGRPLRAVVDVGLPLPVQGERQPARIHGVGAGSRSGPNGRRGEWPSSSLRARAP